VTQEVQGKTPEGALKRVSKGFDTEKYHEMKSYNRNPDTRKPLTEQEKALLAKVSVPFNQAHSHVIEKDLPDDSYKRLLSNIAMGLMFGGGAIDTSTPQRPFVPEELKPTQ
jgi:hypothetical protein